jgi:hypothetical protein
MVRLGSPSLFTISAKILASPSGTLFKRLDATLMQNFLSTSIPSRSVLARYWSTKAWKRSRIISSRRHRSKILGDSDLPPPPFALS